jgi:hypothetical protein
MARGISSTLVDRDRLTEAGESEEHAFGQVRWFA